MSKLLSKITSMFERLIIFILEILMKIPPFILVILTFAAFTYFIYFSVHAVHSSVKYQFINLDTNEVIKIYQGRCDITEDQSFYEISCKIDGVWHYENIKRSENISYTSEWFTK